MFLFVCNLFLCNFKSLVGGKFWLSIWDLVGLKIDVGNEFILSKERFGYVIG